MKRIVLSTLSTLSTLSALCLAPALSLLCISSAGAQASAPASAAKKELVARVLKLQQPGIENLGRTLAEAPARQLAASVQASGVLQRLSADKREVLGKEIDADLRKYTDEAVPIVRERAVKLAPTTMGPILEQRFSEDELRQLISILESPLNAKFQAVAAEMQRSLGEKLVAETKDAVEPKVQALREAVGKHVNAALAAPAPASGTKR